MNLLPSLLFVLFSVATLIVILAPMARMMRLVDIPNDRKKHGEPVPMVGGLAIYIALVSAIFISSFGDKVEWLIFSAGILVVTGLLDDIFDLCFKLKLLSQIFATSLMMFGGSISIQSIGIGHDAVDDFVQLFSVPITIFAVVGLTNAFNFVDGLDGLASGQVLLGLATMAMALMVSQGAIHNVEWFAVVMTAVFAFWAVNMSFTPVKRVFLGDAGSLLLGFVMAWTLIFYTQKPQALLNPVLALWCVTIPVLDTIVVIVRRLKNDRSPFVSDRTHLHHVLLSIGLSPRKSLFVILIMSGLFNAVGIWSALMFSPLVSLTTFLAILSILILAVFKADFLKIEVER